MPGRSLEGLKQDLLAQRDFVAENVPVYARLLEILLDSISGKFGVRLARAWGRRTFSAFYERPLLLLGALRYDALCEGPEHPLHAAIVGQPPRLEALTETAVAAAIAGSRERLWNAIANRTVQTNETTRAVAWMWPAHLLARAGLKHPLALVDLGTSAGLNLVADALPAPWSDERGEPLEMLPRPPVRTRVGLDIAPLDVTDTDQAQWLRACVWPGETLRLERLEQAIAQFRARAGRPEGPRLEAVPLDHVAERLSRLPADTCVLAVQSIVRDYLSPEERARYEGSMREWIAARPPVSVVWSELELADPKAEPALTAAITARFRDRLGRLRELVLARTHPHPSRLVRNGEAVSEFIWNFATVKRFA